MVDENNNEYVKMYLGYVDAVMAVIPYNRMKVWKEFFLNPSKTLSANIDGIWQRMVDLYATIIIGLVIGIIAVVPLFAVMMEGPEFAKFLEIEVLGISLAELYVGFIVVMLVISPFISLAYAGIEYAVAKALGGAANFQQHFNASVLPELAVFVVALPLSVLVIPFEWLNALPVLNPAFGILSICTTIIVLPISLASALISLYGIYLKYVGFKHIHKLSKGRAIVLIIVPAIIGIGLAFAVMMLLYMLVIAAVVAHYALP